MNLTNQLEEIFQIPFKQQPDITTLRRESHDASYACDANGQLIGLNVRNQKELKKVVIPAAWERLAYLNMSDNEGLEKVVFETALPDLGYVDLSDNKIEHLKIPSGLNKLERLDISRNGLQTIDFQGDLPLLELLDLSDNKIKNFSLPNGMKALKYLYANKNEIQSFQTEAELASLEILHLADNQLAELPVATYSNLQSLYVKGNPLKNQPESLINGDKSGNATEIIVELRAISKSGSRPNYRIKLIIVGNGRIGKTCMVKRLKGAKCPKKQPFTHGISIQELNKKHLPAIKTEKLDLKVWDFGGQEVFYATHQFFLSEEATYIYAWTDEAIATKNQKADEEPSPSQQYDRWRSHDYWLNNIRMHGKDSPILVVKTHCLETVGTFPFEGLKKSYLLKNNPIDFDAFSIEPRYLKNLQEELTRILNTSSLLGSPFAKSFYQAIQDIVARKAKGNTELSKNEFYRLAIKHKIEEKDIDQFLSYLVKTGEVVHFPNNQKIKDRIFIDPQDLTKKFYRIFEDHDHLTKEEGIFTEDYVREKLGWADWEGLLELLVSFELIFKKESNGQLLYIMPQYLKKLPTSGNANRTFSGHKKEKRLVFQLKYPRFLPENVMVNLLSNYGPYSIDAVYRDAIYFIKAKTTKGCIIELEESQRLIKVYAGQFDKDVLVVKEVFDKFLDLSKKAEVHISVDGGQQWIDCHVLLEALQENRDIPVMGGGWIEDSTVFDFLIKNEFYNKKPKPKGIITSVEPTIVEPTPKVQEKTNTMKGKNLTLIIAGIIAIAILLLPIWNHNSGKISILGLINLEINGQPDEVIDPSTPPVTEKATVIGAVYINKRQATSADIKQVSIKGNNTVNPVSLSGNQFTLREVKLPKDKRLDVAIVFNNNIQESKVFTIPDPDENGIVDVGEVRIEYKIPQKSDKNQKPVIVIKNYNSLIDNSKTNNSLNNGNGNQNNGQ